VAARDAEVAERFRNLGATVVRLPLWLRPGQPLDVVPLLYLYHLSKSERFDLMVTHSFKSGLLGGLAARMAGVPRIVHHSQGFRFQVMKGLRRRYYLATEKVAAWAGDLIVTAWEEHRKRALHAGVAPPERLITIRDGVAARPGRPSNSCRKPAFAASKRIIGCVGCLALEWGCACMLRAMPTVLARHPEARLVIACNGALEEQLRPEAALMGLEDRVVFLQNPGETLAAIARFDIFVDASLGAAPAAPLLEAMSAGRAIVASNTQLHRELFEHGHTALLVAPGSARALAEGVTTLLDNPLRALRLGAAAQLAVAKRFSFERAIAEILTVYGAGRTAP
jgi:glycosyltransferase involved in cell wall biosynthesis